MHTTLIKKLVVSATLLLTMEYTSIAFSHTQIGSLTAAVSATDVYAVTCSSLGTVPTDHLEAAIEDNAPVNPALLSVVVSRGNTAITSTDTSAVDGDLIYSPFVQLGGGNGVYTVFVNKTGANPENYILAYHCKNSTGLVHTGTAIKILQNQ